jgi:hypothetical protein
MRRVGMVRGCRATGNGDGEEKRLQVQSKQRGRGIGVISDSKGSERGTQLCRHMAVSV